MYVDVVWTFFSLAWTILAVTLCAIPIATILTILVQVKRNPEIVYEEGSRQMDAFHALNFDDYAQEYFEEGPEYVHKERTKGIMMICANMLFVSILAKSFIAMAAFVLLYALAHTFDSFLCDYYYRTYWEETPEGEDEDEDEPA